MADYVRSEQKTLLPFLGSSTKNHTSQSLCECLKTQKLSRIMRFFWFLGVETFLGLVNFLPNPVSSTNFHRRSLLDQLGNKAQKCLERERNPFVNAASFMDETEGSSKQDRSVQSGVNHQKYVEAQITTQNLKNQEIRPGRKAKDKGNPSISSDNHQPFSKVKGSPNAQKASPKESVSSVTDKAFPQEKDLPGGTQHQAYVHLRSSENHAHEFSTQSHLAPPYYPEHQSSSTEYYGLNAASDINPAVVPEGYALRETIQPALYPGYFQTKAPVVTWQDVWQFAYQPVNIVQHELVPLPPNFQFRSGSSYPVAQGKEQTVTTSPKSKSRSNELTPQEKLRPLPKSGANSVISSKQSPGPLSSIGPERLNHDIPEPVHESSANALAKSDSFRNTSLKNPLVTEKTPPKDPLGIGVSQGIRKAAHIFQNPEFGSNGDGLRKKWAQVVKGGEFVPPSKTETDSGASMKSSTEPLIGNKLRISPLQVDTESMSNLVPDENASKSAAGSTSASKTNLENKGVTGTRIDQEMSEKSDNSSLKMTTQGASSTKKNIEEKSLPEGKKPVPSGSYSISRWPQESSGNQMLKAQVESFPSFKSPESDLNTISTKSERHVSLNSPDSNFWNKNFLQAIAANEFAAQKPEKLGNMHHRKVGIALKAKSPRESKSTVTEIRGGINKWVTAPSIPSIEHSRVMNERQGAVKNYTPSLGLQRTGDFIKNNNQGSSQDKDGWTLVQNKRKKLVSPGATDFQLMNSAEDGRMEIPPGEVDKHSEKLGLSEAQKRPMSLQTPPNSSFEKSQKESQNSLVEKAITEPGISPITKNRQQIPSENSQKQPEENDERGNQQGPDTIEKAKKKSSKIKKKINKGSRKIQTLSLSSILKQENAEKTFLDNFEAPKEANTFINEQEREDSPLGKATLPPMKNKKKTRFDFESTAVSSLKPSQQALEIKPEIMLIQVGNPNVGSLPKWKKEEEIVFPHFRNVFEPWEKGRQTSEIFPNIIKPQRKLRNAEVTKKNKALKILFKRKGEGKKLEEWQEIEIKNYHLANQMAQHLKVDNHEEHLALESMSLDLYQLLRSGWQPTAEGSDVLKLQFWARRRCLGDVEGSRRVWTLSRQIFKHTIVENWKIIKTSLVKNNELSFTEADIIERVYQLSDLTPDFVTIANTFPEGPFLSAKVGKENTVGSLLRILMGPEETNVRTKLGFHMKTNQESARWWENTTIAKAAEQHGLDVWRVIEIAEALHLRSEDDLAYQLESTEAEKVIETLKSNILRGKGEFFSWPDSPERAWLVQQFGELFQRRLNYVCEQARGRLEVPSAPQITLHPADLLQWYDSGLDPKMLGSIRSAIARHTINGITNWEALFSERSEPLTEQQKLIFMRWFETENAVKAEPGKTNAAKHNRSKSL